MRTKLTGVVLVGLIIIQAFTHQEAQAAGLKFSKTILAIQKKKTAKPQPQKPQENRESDDVFMLMNYIAVNHVEEVNRLLEKGVDVNSKARGGMTPLMLAASVGNRMKIMDILLAKGAEVNAKSDSDMTPLMFAIGFDEAKLLLEKGAEVNAKNDEGKTTLILAVEKYQTEEFINLLLTHGAEVNARDKKGNTALTIATRMKQPEVVAWLKKAATKK